MPLPGTPKAGLRRDHPSHPPPPQPPTLVHPAHSQTTHLRWRRCQRAPPGPTPAGCRPPAGQPGCRPGRLPPLGSRSGHSSLAGRAPQLRPPRCARRRRPPPPGTRGAARSPGPALLHALWPRLPPPARQRRGCWEAGAPPAQPAREPARQVQSVAGEAEVLLQRTAVCLQALHKLAAIRRWRHQLAPGGMLLLPQLTSRLRRRTPRNSCGPPSHSVRLKRRRRRPLCRTSSMLRAGRWAGGAGGRGA